ncbi:MAG: cbb3-type cytochrome c oxidase N-terminal domain-containing protein [Acidobacteriota bacterium]
MSGKRDELLEHDVDGIREFDNDLPRWWLYGFYVTIVFAAVYLVNYHLLATPVSGEKTLIAEYEADVKAHPRPVLAAAVGHGGAAIVRLEDADSLAKGKTIFESQGNPCFACHRPDLGGVIGPNLTDDKWLHGCTLADIVNDITTGYPLQGMPPYGGGAALSQQQLVQVGSYILSKRGSQPPAPKPPDAARDLECQ